MTGPVIAIDGPAGAGKSTVAQAVATRLAVPHFDTGALYRAVTWAVLREGVALDDAEAIAAVTEQVDVAVSGAKVMVDDIDVTTDIRGPAVTAAVSAVSAVPEVREMLVATQREWVGEAGAGVMEGRDIGTVVLPDADLKVYLTATPLTRARRRLAEGTGSALDEVVSAIERRDELDSTRAVSPLRPADGATVIWTDELDIDGVVDHIVAALGARGAGGNGR